MTEPNPPHAPGWPGIAPRWTSSAKSGVGTAIGSSGRVWFTISHGILNEIYYPRVDQACTRDMGLLVTGPDGLFAEEKRHTHQQVSTIAEGVPAFRLTNTCTAGRYRIVKEIVADPHREVILQRVRFTALQGARSDYHLYAILAPHLGNAGNGNTAWLGDYKGAPMLFAERDGTALTLACSRGWLARSVGFVGASDGWQQLHDHGELRERYDRAENGNVAITGEIALEGPGDTFTIAIGFGRTAAAAGHRAAASLRDGFDRAAADYRHGWEAWQRTLTRPPTVPAHGRDLFRVSASVLRIHESARFPGGIIASLSIPWGFSKGDGDLGGYHLVWPRDLVESAGGLLAAGAHHDVRRVLRYLAVTQEADGHWPQNMWLDGEPYWRGIQMDETGFPILLVDLARRWGALDPTQRATFWPMVRRAAGFLVANGPVTDQDRWEEDPGYSPFTLAVEIAALLVAAELADTHEPAIAPYLREAADAWNAMIEPWTWVTDTELSRRLEIPGYYVRIAPPEEADGPSPAGGFVPIKNRPPNERSQRASPIISPDALALVRFGLRAAADPRIVSTVTAIDALLRVELPQGPAWYRYNGDGYGEHADGRSFDGTGTGRPWPLLTGERAHYELAAGRPEVAASLMATFAAFANDGGLLPEQAWDADDIPERELFRGRPAGSAMPLVWAHAEYVKLLRSLADGKTSDTPPQPVQRYQVEHQGSPHHIWRFNQKCRHLPAGQLLRVELRHPALVHWSDDGWATVHDTPTRDTGLGVHLADLDTTGLRPDREITFTFNWLLIDRWEGADFTVGVVPAPPPTATQTP
jgi:glucoamylase